MKVVGIVGRAYYNKDKQKIFQVNEDIRRYFSKYSDVVVISLLPTNSNYYVDVSMGNDILAEDDKKRIDYVLDMCDAFVVPGGTYYYKFDEYIINYAIKNNKPLLAICLGFQCMCSMFANNRNSFDMTKKLDNDSHYGNREKYIHSIKIDKDSLLYKIIKKDTIKINSIHHDYIAKDMGMDILRVSAVSHDGLVEAVEYPNKKFILGVQWHPEYLDDDNSRKIFDSFISNI